MRRSRQNLRKMGLEREMKFKDRGRNAKVLGQGEGDGFGKGGGRWLLIFPVLTGLFFLRATGPRPPTTVVFFCPWRHGLVTVRALGCCRTCALSTDAFAPFLRMAHEDN